MGRVIASIVVGYLTMFVGVFVLLSGAWAVLGTDGAFQAGSWSVSGMWLAVSIVVGIVAAIGGGYVCAAIAGSPRGPQWLVIIVLVLGFAMAIPVFMGSAEAVTEMRPATVGMFEAMQNAKQPVWIALLNPILGAVGVLIGAGMRKPAVE